MKSLRIGRKGTVLPQSTGVGVEWRVGTALCPVSGYEMLLEQSTEAEHILELRGGRVAYCSGKESLPVISSLRSVHEMMVTRKSPERDAL